MPAPDWDQPVQVDLHDIYKFSAYFDWGQKTVGFGQLSLTIAPDKTVVKVAGDTETMGREWVRKALHALADTVANALPADKAGMAKLYEGIEIPVPEEVLVHRRKFHKMATGEEPDF